MRAAERPRARWSPSSSTPRRRVAAAEPPTTTARRRAPAGRRAGAPGWRPAVEALQLALDAARARAGAERLAGVDGVLGTLLDLVRIDAGWESAVEAALGEALDRRRRRRPRPPPTRALHALRGSDTTGAVLALGLRPPSWPCRRPAGEPVRPHVAPTAPASAALLDRLLAGAVRVADLDAAIDAAGARSRRRRRHRRTATASAPPAGASAPPAGGVTAAALADAERRAPRSPAARRLRPRRRRRG